jgi:stage II sporulation protein D
MNTEQKGPPDDREHPELAAAIAAVFAFMQSSSNNQSAQASPAVSNWRKAALLEGVNRGQQARRPGGFNAWTAALGVAASLLLSCQSVGAYPTDSSSDMVAYNGGSSVVSADDPAASAQGAPTGPAPCLLDSVCQSLLEKNRILLKVALCLGNRSVQIDAPDGATIVSFASVQKVASLPAHSRWTVTPSSPASLCFNGRTSRDGAVLASEENTSLIRNVAYTPNLTVPLHSGINLPASPGSMSNGGGYVVVPQGKDPGDQLVGVNGRLYRGAVWLRPTPDGSSVQAVNVVGLEDYLLSVLPSEMPSTWAPAALEAQAIAARSYAVANLGKHARDGYDLRATTDDQVYLGVSSEHQASNDAVTRTSGLILKYQGKPVTAYFHSTSGGCTEAPEQAWGKSVPYLRSVVDFDDCSPHFSWVRKVSTDDINRAFGGDVGRVQSMQIVTRSPSNRVKMAVITGSSGTKTVTGDNLRLILRLPSSNFNVGYEDRAWTFAGRGFGHGMGMSQYGARTLAEQGYNAAQILTYYYRDVSVEYVAGTPGI